MCVCVCVWTGESDESRRAWSMDAMRAWPQSHAGCGAHFFYVRRGSWVLVKETKGREEHGGRTIATAAAAPTSGEWTKSGEQHDFAGCYRVGAIVPRWSHLTIFAWLLFVASSWRATLCRTWGQGPVHPYSLCGEEPGSLPHLCPMPNLPLVVSRVEHLGRGRIRVSQRYRCWCSGDGRRCVRRDLRP